MSRSYSNVVSVGDVRQASAGINGTNRLFAAVTAINLIGIESSYSPEISVAIEPGASNSLIANIKIP